MKALVLTELSGPAGLVLSDVADPTGDALVHIDVRSIGINYPDLLVMRGEYQMKIAPPFVPGAEVSGVVTAAPDGSGFSAGDRVVALTGAGGYAEKVAVHPTLVLPSPIELDDAQAVALVANHQTAYFALRLRAQLREGETVVVLGAAGGIGSAAIQVAAMVGANVIGVVHRDGADQFVRSMGASQVVRLREGWAQQVRDITGGRGA
ncbi:MAG: alcohol dehydrogenase, partial [Aeromicrobium sp.]|nr:alcohol dehydrogenase [Aeromicrobium sp.]